MKRSIVFLFLGAVLLQNCQPKENRFQTTTTPSQKPDSLKSFALLQTHCYACHNPEATSHDALLAPPMAAVKSHYLRTHTHVDSFVKAMTQYVALPDSQNSLMPGAIKKFGLMPQQAFPVDDVAAIAAHVFHYKPEEPSWYAEHHRQKHQGMQDEKHKHGGNGKKHQKRKRHRHRGGKGDTTSTEQVNE